MMAADMTIPEFTPMTSEATPLTPPGEGGDLLPWLATTGAADLRFLLATTHSEVVWGKYDGGWVLSNGKTTLPADSLLELRAFGPAAEVFVWRDANGLRGRLRVDGAGGTECDIYKEEQLLWGTVRLGDVPDELPGGFTRLAEGDQGLVHAPPLTLDESYFITDPGDKQFGYRPARLVLRHYVGRDEKAGPSEQDGPDKGTGLARVVDSRLVGVEGKRPENGKDKGAAAGGDE